MNALVVLRWGGGKKSLSMVLKILLRYKSYRSFKSYEFQTVSKH